MTLTPGRSALLCGGTVALSGVLLGLYAGAITGRVAGEEAARRGRSAAAQLAGNAVYGLMTDDRVLLEMLANITLQTSDADIVGVVVRNAEGEILVQSWRPGHSVAVLPGPAGARQERRALSAGGAELVLFGEPARSERPPQWRGEVDVAMMVDEGRRAARSGALARILGVAALLSAASAAAGWLLGRTSA